MAVLSTGAAAPCYKANVELSVRTAEPRVLARLCGQTFIKLAERSTAIRRCVNDTNRRHYRYRVSAYAWELNHPIYNRPADVLDQVRKVIPNGPSR